MPVQLVIGQRVSQPGGETGVITDVTLDEDETPFKFTVEVDDGSEKIFLYPVAFNMGMKIL